MRTKNITKGTCLVGSGVRYNTTTSFYHIVQKQHMYMEHLEHLECDL